MFILLAIVAVVWLVIGLVTAVALDNDDHGVPFLDYLSMRVLILLLGPVLGMLALSLAVVLVLSIPGFVAAALGGWETFFKGVLIFWGMILAGIISIFVFWLATWDE